MNNNLPSQINGNRELQMYEEYLESIENSNSQKDLQYITQEKNMSYIPSDNKNIPESLKNTAYMPAYLSKHLGKLVRVEFLIGNELHQRIGILMTVGAGFIVLRFKNNATLVCDLKSIRFVTIIHNNDMNGLLSNY